MNLLDLLPLSFANVCKKYLLEHNHSQATKILQKGFILSIYSISSIFSNILRSFYSMLSA